MRAFPRLRGKVSSRFCLLQVCALIRKAATPRRRRAPLLRHQRPAEKARLTVTDKWVLFARPRSQHVVLQDIDRLRRSAGDEKHPIEGLPKRLVTEPSREAPDGATWEPLSTRIGGTDSGGEAPLPNDDTLDVFFPKPFNDDQLEIIRKLSQADGLVVQGPPGTGKTHTIANLICHAMATGQRVLVVSRGEAALAVLKEQLPAEVRPLAISVLSNEREGLRQIESAIREIQGVVERTQPQNRRATITRLEQELDGLRKRIIAIDQELDTIALAHLTKIGPRGETPAELAQRVVAERDVFRWFVDRPLRFASEIGLSDQDITALFEARVRCGDLIDHLKANLPSPTDLPDANTLARWHDDLNAAATHAEAARRGPARALRITAENAAKAQALAQSLDNLARAHQAVASARWMEPFRRAVITGQADAWCDRLRERIEEWTIFDSERAALLKRSVELPDGLIDSDDACAAVSRGAIGQKIWPLMALGKGAAKALVSAIRLDGAPVRDEDIEGWRHTVAVIANANHQREVKARWDAFAKEIGAPTGEHAKSAADLAEKILRIWDDARSKSALLTSIVVDAVSIETLAHDSTLCMSLAKQMSAAATSTRLAAVEQDRRRLLQLFRGDDRTSVVARQFFEDVIGKPSVTSDKVASIWSGLLRLLAQIKTLIRDFQIIDSTTRSIAAAGAPEWAKALSTEKAAPDDPRILSGVARRLGSCGRGRSSRADRRTPQMAEAWQVEREAADKRAANSSAKSSASAPSISSSGAFRAPSRRPWLNLCARLPRSGTARARRPGCTGEPHAMPWQNAMARCRAGSCRHGASRSSFLPSWAPSNLVIIDEASQSDITELPALLRGKKILVVGDDRQVSPTAPFVTQEKIGQLRHHYLGDMPFKSLLEPGESIYDLMRAVFPNERLMLKEHFRCVEPIIRFSMQFYPEKCCRFAFRKRTSASIRP